MRHSFHSTSAAVALLLFAIVPCIARADGQIVGTGDTSTPIKFLLVDTATGQVGQTGKTGSAIGTKVACSGGIAGSITATVQISASGTTTAPANASGSIADAGNGIYDYYPASGEVTNATTLPRIVDVHVSCAGCISQDYTEEVLQGPLLTYGSGTAQINPISGQIALQANQAVNASQIGGQTVVLDGNNLLEVDLHDYRESIANALISGRPDVSVGAYPGNTAQSGDLFGVVNPLVSAGKFTSTALSLAPGGGGGGIVSQTGTAQSGSTSSTLVLQSTASATNGYYYLQPVAITSGTGAGQVSAIVAYVGATRTATVWPPWAVTPDNTSVYSVIGAICSSVVYGFNPSAAAPSGFLDSTSIGNIWSAYDILPDTILRRAYELGKFSYNPGSGVITFYEADGVTVAFSATLTHDGSGNTTGRTGN